MAKEKEVKEEEIDEIEIEVDDKKQRITIEEYDFKMISSRPTDCRFFDLYFVATINKGKSNERKEFKIEGYGVTLKNCLAKIATMRAGNANKKEFTSFKEFAIEYLKQVNEVKILFGTLPKNDD